MTETETDYLVELYSPDDYPTIEAWWRGHDGEPVPEEWLPTLCAFAVDPADGRKVAFMALYMDNSVGVCFPNWLVTDPANTVAQSRRGFAAVDRYLRAQAHDEGYHLAFANVHSAVMVPEAESRGYLNGGESTTLFAQTLNFSPSTETHG